MPQQKGRVPEVKKLLLPLSADLHHAVKIRAAEQNVTMREFITAAIRQALEKRGKRKD
jgi:predicted HicB family RNase H-like nuclease